MEPKKDCKSNDLESDKTDLESTHSSNMSGLPEKQIIPPDALYSSNEKMMNIKNSSAGYISYEAVFNDSKESLRPDLVNSSNLNRTNSSEEVQQQRISYNDLCFPKTSNYGSMKKKNRQQQHYLVQQLRAQQQLHQHQQQQQQQQHQHQEQQHQQYQPKRRHD